MSVALKTDRYEFSMLQSFIKSGKVNDDAVFEVFTRRLQPGRRFGVFAGLGRLLPLIENFRFDAKALEQLAPIVDEATFEYLTNFRFTGRIDAYAEGDLFFPHSPVLTVSGKLGECILLETLILSVLNFDSAIATTASRFWMSAKGRPLIEMGSRRTNEDAAVAAARAAYIAGFASTSNMEAGRVWDIPTQGTAAHAFTLAYPTEKEAFKAQIDTYGPDTTLLVDTYDIEQGIRNAVEVAGTSLRAIRIDSGDLASEAFKARALLDSLRAYGTRIVVTSDLDEYVLKDLAEAPIDGYGAGTRLVAGAPMGFVYKLVEINGTPVAKKSKDKVSLGGYKVAWRIYDDNLKIVDEVFTRDITVKPDGKALLLNKPVFVAGETHNRTIQSARGLFQQSWSELPLGEQRVWNGDFSAYIEVEEWKP